MIPLNEVEDLALKVRSVQEMVQFDEAMSALRALFPGCSVVLTPAWGLLLIATTHSRFTEEDLQSVVKATIFDCIVRKEEGEFRTLFGLIPEQEAKIYDSPVFTSGAAIGESRWSHLC